VGHCHEPFRFEVVGGAVANPGALFRRPVDEADTIKVFDTKKDAFVDVAVSSGGTFGVLDVEARRFEVERAAGGKVVRIVRVEKG
jgi:predicted phosphodiesterase